MRTLVLRLWPGRARARQAALAEAVAMLRDPGATALPGGPLSEQPGVAWVGLPDPALREAAGRLPRLGYTASVSVLVPAEEAEPGDEPVRWRRRPHALRRLAEIDASLIRDRAPDRRSFLLVCADGVARRVPGYRGGRDPLSHRALPATDARLLVNLVHDPARGRLLDPFAGAGGIVLEAAAGGWTVASADVDRALRYGLAELAWAHAVADARALPFATGAFAAVATEPPYHPSAAAEGWRRWTSCGASCGPAAGSPCWWRPLSAGRWSSTPPRSASRSSWTRRSTGRARRWRPWPGAGDGRLRSRRWAVECGPMTLPISGCLAAAVTPLAADGERLDEAAIQPLTDFLAGAGLDGLLAMGTTGEGVLLTTDERRRVTEAFVAAAAGRVKVIAHCGAQTTRDTVALAEHAAAAGADGVAVIGPPYFALDDAAILAHFLAAGRACAPLPFYVYEFAARSGYAVPLPVIQELRSALPNMAGLKVSDTPWERLAPYLVPDLAIFVGAETLVQQGMAHGAVGAVSALATALPELVIAAVRGVAPDASERCGAARQAIQRFPFNAALKRLLIRRGVPLSDAVRAPLRGLSAAEAAEFDAVADRVLEMVTGVAAT